MMTLALIPFVLALWRPVVALALVAAALPAYQIRSTIAGIPTTLLELGFYALTVGALIHELRAGQLRRRLRETWLGLRPYRWGLGLVLVSGAVATAFSPDVRASLGAFKAWYVDAALFFALIAAFRRAVGRWIVMGLAVGTTAISAWGLWEFFFSHATLEDGRLNSVFATANYHALLIVPVTVLLCGIALRRSAGRLWLLAAVIVNLAALLLTLSYGGFVGLFVGLLVLGLSRFSFRQRLATLGLLALLGIGLLLSQARTDKFERLADFEGRSSVSVRLQVWRTTSLMIREHPFVGVGPGAYETVYRETVPRVAFPPLEWLVALPHNFPLAVAALTGMLGVAAFVLLYMEFFRASRATAPWLRVGVVAAMIAMLVHGLVDTPFFKNDLSALTFGLMALALITDDR